IVIRSAVPASAANGHLSLRGQVVFDPAVDSFAVASGLAIHLDDGGAFVLDDGFEAGECTSAGNRIRCAKAADPASQAKFRRVPRTAGVLRFTIRLDSLTATGAPAAPLNVVFTTDGSVDRVGSLPACRTTPVGALCTASH